MPAPALYSLEHYEINGEVHANRECDEVAAFVNGFTCVATSRELYMLTENLHN